MDTNSNKSEYKDISTDSNSSVQVNVQIIAETPDYLIISKPSGLMVHGDGVSMDPTLVDWLLEHYPEIDGVGEDWHMEKKGNKEEGKNKNKDKNKIRNKESVNEKEEKDAEEVNKDRDESKDCEKEENKEKEEMIIKRPGIVHRLDRDTSGAMVVARTQEFFDFMKKQFQDHLVQKSYRAYVYGHMKHDTGVIDAPIGRSRTDIRQWSATRGARGNMREAITEYKVLARGHDEAGEKYSYVEFRPRTGRTHQIRVHAKYMNYPIVGDALYAGKLIDRGNLGFQRQALHACSLSFSDEEENRHDYTASFPDDFLRAEILFKNV